MPLRQSHTEIVDDPISSPDEDLLSRTGFAKSIASLIADSTSGGSFRMGVYGGWGEGKTSVLKLVERDLRQAGHCCVWILPWGATTTEELLRQLVERMAEEVGLGTKDTIRHRVVGYGSRIVGGARTLGSELSSKFKLADQVIGGALQSVADKYAGGESKRLFRKIQDALQGRKLIVFVDDLDRAQPDLVPKLLLAIREALSFPNTYYVLALSLEVVKEGLQSTHAGWKDPHRFLEKIVEYPMFLPPLTESEIKLFLKSVVASLPDYISSQVLLDLTPLLPRNPRQLKLFLRFLVSLRTQLVRFDASEVDLGSLYLCQMLRVEFPDAARKMIEDPSVLRHMAQDRMIRLLERKSSIRDEAEKPEHALAPDRETNGREYRRFITICEALRERSGSLTDYDLEDLLVLFDRPVLLTWREFHQIYDRFVEDHSEGLLAIEKFVGGDEARAERLRALFAKSIEFRQNQLGALVDLTIEEEITESIEELSGITDLIMALIEEFGVLRQVPAVIAPWKQLQSHVSTWSRFSKPDYYCSLRAVELELLTLGARDLPQEMQEQVLTYLQRFDVDREVSERVDHAITEIEERFSAAASRRLLSRFTDPDGVVAVAAADTEFPAEQVLLLSPSSLFHRHFREELEAVASRASTDRHVQKNFLALFRFLAYASSGRARASQSDAQALLSDASFVRIVWNAAVARPLNLRVVGSLREPRAAVVKLLRGDEEPLRKPEWFSALEHTHFTSSVESEENIAADGIPNETSE